MIGMQLACLRKVCAALLVGGVGIVGGNPEHLRLRRAAVGELETLNLRGRTLAALSIGHQKPDNIRTKHA
jgi:hypothetical protein